MDVSGYSDIPFVEHGRDHSGCDCYGLLILLFKEQFGIDLPPYYSGSSRHDAVAIAALIEPERSRWLEVKEADAMPGDVVLLKIWNQPMHVGMIFAPGRMIHAIQDVGVCVGRLDDKEWRDRKLGFYRHEKLWRAQDNRANYDMACEALRTR